jgi:predicted lipoprotein with Yx(FWY)xxD motif
MEIPMKRVVSTRLLALGIALGAIAGAAVFVAPALGGASKGAVVSLKKTTLGAVLVDARGRTLYLFEKDRGGMSACNSSCAQYWPALTSRAAPRAGTGVKQSLLHRTKQHNGSWQVTYAGHPLYTFVGDKRAGQTSGEGLTNFGAGWYVLTANGKKVEETTSSGSSNSGSSGSSGGYGW